MTKEEKRLEEDRQRQAYWRRWGTYLSERQWGTVREDYSPHGTAWDYFPHEHARSRAYRWGEDGIAGISDNHQRLCFAVALWNGEDSILKERLFGLTGPEGNHGEDVKEYYFYLDNTPSHSYMKYLYNLDNTPSHSYMKYLYKYPQDAFPYERLLQENQQRGYLDPEFELLDTGIFDNNEYFDVFVEYAKSSPEDILIQIKINNRASSAKTLHLLPTLWFRNTWSWEENSERPLLKIAQFDSSDSVIEASHPSLGRRWLYCQNVGANCHSPLLFTENETNNQKLFGVENHSPYVKDGINDRVVNGIEAAVNPEQIGTKAACYYLLNIDAGSEKTVRLRLSDRDSLNNPFQEFDSILSTRKQEADEFYFDLVNSQTRSR